MLKLGITGGIGSGKSTVSQLLGVLGVPVYIADDESKKMTMSSPIIRIKLIELFGEELYDGELLNKKLLASHIFTDKRKLKIVNAIIHPEVEKHFLNWSEIHQSYPIVGHESAILFESGLNLLMDKVIMVSAPLEIRVSRVMNRDQVSREKVLERINNQMSDEEKARLSDFVINNDGESSLIPQTLTILEQCKKYL